MSIKINNFTKALLESFGVFTYSINVHANDLHVTVKGNRLVEGQRVGFDIRRDMKGDKAINVRVLG
ncbi:MAG: cold-shock protein [bacterium]